MDAKLIKIDRNGTKYYEGLVTCPRCNGDGVFITGVCNGRPVLAQPDHGVCWKCLGKKVVQGSWKEYTPEYEAKLEARRRAKFEKEEAEREAIRLEKQRKEEAEQAEREARIKAMKSISQYVGEAGQKITSQLTLSDEFEFTRPAFGFGTETVNVYVFTDSNGNKLKWMTTSILHMMVDGKYEYVHAGDVVTIKATIKEHSEYKDEKQTMLQRVKIVSIDKRGEQNE